MQVTDKDPFPGAKTAYQRAYKLLKWMGEEGGYVTQIKNGKGKTIRCEVHDDMRDLIEALNRGQEEIIKATLLNSRFFDRVHGAAS